MLKLTTDKHEASRGLSATAELLVPCDSRRSKGVPSCSGVFLRLLIRELWTPKLAKIFAYGKWPYPYRMRRVVTRRVKSEPNMSKNA